jgi:Uma2 family endonuclease
MAVERALGRLSVAEYHQLAEARILREDDRVELIDGEIVQMSPIGRRHAAMVRRLIRCLTGQAGDTYLVDVQNPLQLSDDTEPQPDVVALRYREDCYEVAAPMVADALLLIEVADSSLAYDRAVKLPRYALAGIREAWLVDIDGRRIERHTNPVDGRYCEVATIRRGQGLASTVVPALVLEANRFLPAA